MGYMHGQNYLNNGLNYSDLPRETKIKLLEYLTSHHEFCHNVPTAHPHKDFDKKAMRSHKKVIMECGHNHHEVSPEYKQLGFLHADGRLEKWMD